MRRPDRVEGILYLPFAVYGTLLSGERNDRLWIDHGYAEPCVIPNLRLWASRLHDSFPYGVKDDSHQTVGELVWVEPDAYLDTLDRLDILEGVPKFYKRTQEFAECDGELISCWLYTVSLNQVVQRQPIPENDWRLFTSDLLA
jgi:gamma-glutamylcyclotransferase (GGCT)/AIG2-like uncharacterized protein YtfP